MNKYFFLAGLIGTLLISACEKDERNIQQFDADNIQAYIKANNLQMTQYGNTGIYYQVTKPGMGPAIDYSKQLPVIYTERSLDGKYVSSDTIRNRYGRFFGYFRPDSLRSTVYNILKNQGGEIRVLIPSKLAYGTEGSGGVPGNASLDYTVKLLDVNALPQYDDAVIQKYIQANSLTGFIKTASGLYYRVENAGTGTDAITDNSNVTVDYTGKLMDATTFETNTGIQISPLNGGGIISGWVEGLKYIKQGGTVRLLIPSQIGYGIQGNFNPNTGIYSYPFTCFDFNIKVTAVTN